MSRKCIVHSIQLDGTPTEILSHNPNRIRATIYGDVYNEIGAICLGASGQQAKSSAVIELYSISVIWEGINPLWAVAPGNPASVQGFTIIELIEE